MLKSEMEHHFWVTKKTVQRRFGSKEDEHIISSDAELDTKIEVFKSISNTCTELAKIIDEFEERCCILSQEECQLGNFLKEVGKRSKTTGDSIIKTGKAVSYIGQQRICVRHPLMRFQQEVEVFREQAVRDTQQTIQTMEKDRTEYRAALSWMKSASAELDPDTGKGLEKFRTAQSHVRIAKQNFDLTSMATIQKIDLLAAARCNMFSHALLIYVTELRGFSERITETLESMAKCLEVNPKYDFCVLKELTQNEGKMVTNDMTTSGTTEIVDDNDKDRCLYFAKEYADDVVQQIDNAEKNQIKQQQDETNEHNTIFNDETILIEFTNDDDNDVNENENENEPDDFLLPFDLISINDSLSPTTSAVSAVSATGTALQGKSLSFWSKIFNNSNQNIANNRQQQYLYEFDTKGQTNNKSRIPNKHSNTPWMDLFASLDPLSNPEAFDLKLLNGGNNLNQQI